MSRQHETEQQPWPPATGQASLHKQEVRILFKSTFHIYWDIRCTNKLYASQVHPWCKEVMSSHTALSYGRPSN